MKCKIKNKIKGFSLIEMLIATTLFTFVTFVAITTLFMMQTVNNKMKSTKTVYDNMFLVVDDISRETKYGTYFENYNHSLAVPADCTAAESCVSYEYINSETLATEIHGYYLSADNAIYKYVETAPNVYEKEKITTDDIDINSLKFKIAGNGSFNDAANPDTRHPSIKLLLRGQTKNDPIITFYIESYLTQRISAN